MAQPQQWREPSSPEDTHSPQPPQQRELSSPTSLKIPPEMQAMIHVEYGPSKKSDASITALDLTEDTSLPLNPQFHHLLLMNLESLTFKLARHRSQTQIPSLMIKFSWILTLKNGRKALTRKSHSWKAKTHGLKFQLQKPLPRFFQAHGYFVTRELLQESSPSSRQDIVSDVIYTEDIPETYAPVVSWITIRLVLVFTLT